VEVLHSPVRSFCISPRFCMRYCPAPLVFPFITDIPRYSRETGCEKSCGHPANKAHSAIPAPHPAIPAKAGIQCKLSAERAHCGAWRPAPPLKGARSARFICWIPAFAGMAGWRFSILPSGVFASVRVFVRGIVRQGGEVKIFHFLAR